MEVVADLCRKDPRYHPDAYIFVREALDFTAKKLKKPSKGPAKHITGKELLEGIRQYALREYGPMSLTVLQTWGVSRTEDFGEIVFALVEAGRLGKTDSDRKEDFAGGYEFREVFEWPFLPSTKRPPDPHRRRSSRRKGLRGE